MTNIESKLIKSKLGVVELTKHLGSVSDLYKTMEIYENGGNFAAILVPQHYEKLNFLYYSRIC
jgi:hypothetical protein